MLTGTVPHSHNRSPRLFKFNQNPRGGQAVTVSTIFTALALLIVLLRLYTRFFLVRSPGIEDYGITLAMVGHESSS